ncbi:MAG: hypothetical protein ACREP3_08085, partial [Candidatus Binatia bacterium]
AMGRQRLAHETGKFNIAGGEREFTTKGLARQSRNQNSEYLRQRRKGRKGKKTMPNLAPWREENLLSQTDGDQNLRDPRKLSRVN